MERLTDSDLESRPTRGKHSIGELLEHIAIICEADILISNEATQDEMNAYYANVHLKNLDEIKSAIRQNQQRLQDKYQSYSEEEILQKTTSYWGVTYTRFEWLLEIVAHLYHHRGQLHAMLVHCLKNDPKVALFE